MRAIWVDQGNDASYHRLTELGITDPYYDIRDSRLNIAYLNKVLGLGFRPGLYACSQGEGWPTASQVTGPEWADWVYQKVQKEIAPGTSGSYPKVCLNCETHDADWIVAMLKRWRVRSPRRETYWSPEGRQGGLFKPGHVAAINSCNVGVVPQFFRGNMDPQPAGVVLEMMKMGFEATRLWGFYDAANLPWQWWGMAFTQGRLPPA